MASREAWEDRVAKAFRVMKGGKDNVGWKNPWWTKEYGGGESREWFMPKEVSDAEWIVLDVVNRFGAREKQMIRVRYGGGRVAGYRKCGKEMKMTHWQFFEQFKPVAVALKKALDTKPLLDQ